MRHSEELLHQPHSRAKVSVLLQRLLSVPRPHLFLHGWGYVPTTTSGVGRGGSFSGQPDKPVSLHGKLLPF